MRGWGAGPRGERAEAGRSVGRAEPGQAGDERAGLLLGRSGPAGRERGTWAEVGLGFAGFGFAAGLKADFFFGFFFQISICLLSKSNSNKV